MDPHRLKSYTKRQMRPHPAHDQSRPIKKTQTFYCLDAETHEPITFTSASGARTVAQATAALLELAQQILGLAPNAALLQKHYQDLPQKLQAPGVNPQVPWLYNFKLDFRFK